MRQAPCSTLPWHSCATDSRNSRTHLTLSSQILSLPHHDIRAGSQPSGESGFRRCTSCSSDEPDSAQLARRVALSNTAKQACESSAPICISQETSFADSAGRTSSRTRSAEVFPLSARCGRSSLYFFSQRFSFRARSGLLPPKYSSARAVQLLSHRCVTDAMRARERRKGLSPGHPRGW